VTPAQGFAVCCLCVAANLAVAFVLGSSPILTVAAIICAGLALVHLVHWLGG
jgi:hypothetical protein